MNIYLALGFGVTAVAVLIFKARRLSREARATLAAALRAEAGQDEFLVSIARFGYVQENRGHE